MATNKASFEKWKAKKTDDLKKAMLAAEEEEEKSRKKKRRDVNGNEEEGEEDKEAAARRAYEQWLWRVEEAEAEAVEDEDGGWELRRLYRPPWYPAGVADI